MEESKLKSEQRQAKLEESYLRLESAIERLIEGQARLEERQAKLEDGVIKLGESQANLEERQAKLEESYLRLESAVERLIEGQARLEERQAKLEDGLIKLGESQLRLEQTMNTLAISQSKLEIDNSYLKGKLLELTFKAQPKRWIRKSYASKVSIMSEEELDNLFEGTAPAVEDEVRLSDAILTMSVAGDNSDKNLVLGVVEVSFTLDEYDLDCAYRRATVLASVGSPVMPIVAGKSKPKTRILELAQSMGILLTLEDEGIIVEGRLVA